MFKKKNNYQNLHYQDILMQMLSSIIEMKTRFEIYFKFIDNQENNEDFRCFKICRDFSLHFCRKINDKNLPKFSDQGMISTDLNLSRNCKNNIDELVCNKIL